MSEQITTAEQWRAELRHRLSGAHMYYVRDPKRDKDANDFHQELYCHVHNQAIGMASRILEEMPPIPALSKAWFCEMLDSVAKMRLIGPCGASFERGVQAALDALRGAVMSQDEPAPQQGPDLVGWHLYRVEGDAGGMLYVIAPNPEVAVRAWAGRYGWDKSQTNFSVQGLNHQLLIAPNTAQGKEAT